MNTTAIPVVRRVRKLPAPPLPKIVELPPPKTAPMSAPFPCCSNTTPIRNKHAMMCMTVTTMSMAFSSHDELDDAHERIHLQACPAYQRTVDVRLRHQRVDVVRLDAPAIQDTARLRGLLVSHFGEHTANQRVHFLSLLRRGDLASADRPYRLVCNNQSPYSSCITPQQSAPYLTVHYRERLLGFPFL